MPQLRRFGRGLFISREAMATSVDIQTGHYAGKVLPDWVSDRRIEALITFPVCRLKHS